VLARDLLLQVHVFDLQLILQSLDFGQCLAQPLVGLLALQLGAGTRGEGLQDGYPQGVLGHRLVVHEDHVPDHTAGRVPQRNPQVALRVHLRQELVLREVVLDVVGVKARLAGGDFHTGRVREVVLEGGRETVAHPDRPRTRVFGVEAFRDVNTAHLEGLRQVLHERREESGPRDGCSAVHDRMQQLLGAALRRIAVVPVRPFAKDH
jgi:hypothetical protein